MYASIGAYIQYCIDMGYLPNLATDGLVPRLTDDSNVLYNNWDENEAHRPYKAFDLTNTVQVKYNSKYVNSCAGLYIGYDFGRQVIVNKMTLGGTNEANGNNCNFDLEGSSDGTTWTKIASITHIKNTAETFEISNDVAYSRIRLKCTSAGGTFTASNGTSLISIMGLQFYGEFV